MVVDEDVVVGLGIFIIHDAEEVAAILIVRRGIGVVRVPGFPIGTPGACPQGHGGVLVVAVHLSIHGPGLLGPVRDIVALRILFFAA